MRPLLLLGLWASVSFSRPIAEPDNEPIPILVLPPGALDHTTANRVPAHPSKGLIIPLLDSDSESGPAPTVARQGGPTLLATTLTVSRTPATATIHVVAETRTVTITVQSPPTPTPTRASAPASTSDEDKPIMATYFPDWTGDEFPPEKVDFNRFAWVDFGKSTFRLITSDEMTERACALKAFAVPDANRQLKFTSDGSEDLLRRLVSAAHGHGSKVKLSVGGWTGSNHFSDAVSNDSNRREFARNIVVMYHRFNLDGIDIDWEYPGMQGAGNNKVSPSDSAHFLTFLQLLRSQLPASAKITAATQVTPFIGSDGEPMKDISEFAQVLDWVLIMNYDVWGASPTPGPNAPLRNGCHNSTQPDASASASVAAWTKAGLPANKITLGLPSYGYVQSSSASRLVQRSRRLRVGKRGRLEEGQDDAVESADSGTGTVRVKGEGEGDDNGQVQFKQLLSEGAIKLTDDGDYVGAGGFSRMWDICSSTPYLVSKTAHQVVAYDDPQSLGMKAAFARGAGLRGVNMFDVHGDTEDWTLTDAIRAGLGLD
ncbi:hypothetical protein FRC10_011052 [Ceratobasidium sp. 414]|nr:hypothetical protein FRC10_011052 [Ceratobasidium sp. 414]